MKQQSNGNLSNTGSDVTVQQLSWSLWLRSRLNTMPSIGTVSEEKVRAWNSILNI
ncbi:MAG: hypothetical protein KAT31_01720 [Bacteroidales bacterium]|nr:hypothetical protein [Bacteroidales bacterium]